MTKLLDSLLSGLQAEVEAASRDIDEGEQQVLAEHKITLEMFAFLVRWFVLAAQNVKQSDEGDVLASPTPAKGRKGKGTKGAKNTKTAASKKQTEAWAWMDSIPALFAALTKVLKLKLYCQSWNAH